MKVIFTLGENEHANIRPSVNWGQGNQWMYFDTNDESVNFTSNNNTYQVQTNEENKWFKISGYRDCEEDSDSTLSIGYFNTEYLYASRNTTCNSKNCLEGFNGLQIYSDNSVLVHILYYMDKLTDTTDGDAYKTWESRAVETGLEIKSESFTYEKKQYKDIPSGYWYTTIVHFADGTVVMTDIKQKQ